MSITAGYHKRLTWHQNLTLLSIAFVAFAFPHIINLAQGTTELNYVKKVIRGLLLLIVGAFLLNQPPQKKHIHLAFSTSLIICFIGVLKAQIVGLDRGDILGHNSIPLMITAVAILSLILPSTISSEKVTRYSVYTAFILTVASVVIAQSKGVALSLLVTLAIFSVFSFKVSPKNVAILWLLLVTSATTTSILTNNALISRVKDASHNVTNHINAAEEQNLGSSSSVRMELWKGAVILANEKPFFGYGKIAARARMLELINEGKIARTAKINSQQHFHSIYFEALGNQGVIGLISMLLVLIIPLYIFIRYRDNNPTFATGGILIITNYMVAGMSDTALTSTLPSITYFLLITLCVAQVTNHNKENRSPDDISFD